MEWAVQGDGAADACRNYSPFEFGYCMVCGKHSKNLHENGGFIVELGNGMSLDVCSADCKAKVEAQQAINAAIAIMSNEAKS